MGKLFLHNYKEPTPCPSREGILAGEPTPCPPGDLRTLAQPGTMVMPSPEPAFKH